MERKNKGHVFKITEEDLKESSFIFSYFQLFLNDIYFLIIITKINIHCKISFESIEKKIKNRMDISLKYITPMKPLLTFCCIYYFKYISILIYNYI